jgi:hypothetical protein
VARAEGGLRGEVRDYCYTGGRLGRSLYLRLLVGLTFEQAVHQIVLDHYIQAVEAAEARRDLTAQIEAMLPNWDV